MTTEAHTESTEATTVAAPTGVILTDVAAANVKRLIAQEGRDDLRLRIAVQPGGCSGLRYQLFFDERSLDGDTILDFNGVEGPGHISYGDVFKRAEREFSAYNFEFADTGRLFQHFRDAEEECNALIGHGVALPAYDQCLKASHLFNLLDARGVISVTERAAYIGRVRDLTKGACAAWMEKNGWAA